MDEIVRLHGVPLSIVPDRDLDLHQDFGKSYSRHWVLVSILVQLFTRRQMDSLKDSFKCWKICYGVVLWIFLEVGICIFH